MKMHWRLLLLAALAPLGFWLWTVLFPGPEKVICRRLTGLARLASFAPGESLIPRAAKVQQLATRLAPEIEIAIAWHHGTQQILAGRDEIIQAAMAAQSHVRSLKVEFFDLNVALAPDQQSAVVELTAKVATADEPDFMVQEMKFTLRKVGGEWLIIKVETVRTLSHDLERNDTTTSFLAHL